MKDSIYTLMHKDIPVLRLVMTKHRVIVRVLEALNYEHLPLNMQGEESLDVSLYKFMSSRTIPNSRKNLPYILESYDVDNALSLSIFAYQVSVSDHYWFKPDGSDLKWADVNFYDNSFLDNLLFLGSLSSKGLNFSTPNTSLNGSLPQMWSKRHGKNVLLKGGTVFNQQPCNEAFISKLLDTTNIPHVQYELVKDHDIGLLSSCDAFTNESTEFVPAWMLGDAGDPKSNRYEEFIAKSESLGIEGVRPFVNAMLAIDYITVNDDRHYGNFGFLRDSESLDWLGMAPIFDNGNTFGYLDGEIRPFTPTYAYRAQPFSTTHDKQIKYVKTLVPQLDLDAMERVGLDHVKAIYGENAMLSQERVEAIETLFKKRIEQAKHVLY